MEYFCSIIKLLQKRRKTVKFVFDGSEQEFLTLISSGKGTGQHIVQTAANPVPSLPQNLNPQNYFLIPQIKTEGYIWCPLCRWEPDENNEWYCDNCGTYWNTFRTGGRCPTCQKLWTETVCLKCQKTSSHRSWYKIMKSMNP